jgi:hypothetical protein
MDEQSSVVVIFSLAESISKIGKDASDEASSLCGGLGGTGLSLFFIFLTVGRGLGASEGVGLPKLMASTHLPNSKTSVSNILIIYKAKENSIF